MQTLPEDPWGGQSAYQGQVPVLGESSVVLMVKALLKAQEIGNFLAKETSGLENGVPFVLEQGL